MSPLCRPFILLLLLCCGPAGVSPAREAPGQPLNLMLGGRGVAVPPPAGFVRVDGIWKEWDDMTGKLLPATNRRLAKYGTPEDLKLVEDSKVPASSSDFDLQILRKFEDKDIGTRTFGELRQQIVQEIARSMGDLDKEMAKMSARANDLLDKEYNLKSKLSFGKPVPLGTFVENDSMVGFSMLISVDSGTAEPEANTASVVACLMMPLNGRLLYLYHGMPYRTEADQKNTETGVLNWGQQVAAANPAFAGPPAKDKGIFGGTARAALIGAAAGLVFFVVRKFLRKPDSNQPAA
jgi:hypothetical protein